MLIIRWIDFLIDGIDLNIDQLRVTRSEKLGIVIVHASTMGDTKVHRQAILLQGEQHRAKNLKLPMNSLKQEFLFTRVSYYK